MPGIKHSEWLEHYDSWQAASSGGLSNFVIGASSFLQALKIPDLIGSTLISVLIISFAATSLDTAARIQRLIISELGSAYNVRILESRYVGAALAVVPGLLLAILAEPLVKGAVLVDFFSGLSLGLPTSSSGSDPSCCNNLPLENRKPCYLYVNSYGAPDPHDYWIYDSEL